MVMFGSWRAQSVLIFFCCFLLHSYCERTAPDASFALEDLTRNSDSPNTYEITPNLTSASSSPPGSYLTNSTKPVSSLLETTPLHSTSNSLEDVSMVTRPSPQPTVTMSTEMPPSQAVLPVMSARSSDLEPSEAKLLLDSSSLISRPSDSNPLPSTTPVSLDSNPLPSMTPVSSDSNPLPSTTSVSSPEVIQTSRYIVTNAITLSSQPISPSTDTKVLTSSLEGVYLSVQTSGLGLQSIFSSFVGEREISSTAASVQTMFDYVSATVSPSSAMLKYPGSATPTMSAILTHTSSATSVSAMLKYTGSVTPTPSAMLAYPSPAIPTVSAILNHSGSPTPSPTNMVDSTPGPASPASRPAVVVVMCVVCAVDGFLILLCILLSLCICGKGFSKVQNVARFNFLLALLSSFILLPFVVANLDYVSCMIFSTFYLFSLLSAILWLLCIAVMVLIVVAKNKDFKNLSKRKWISSCFVMTVGLSSFIAIVTAAISSFMDFNRTEENTCLLTISRGVHWALLAPLIAISLLILFLIGGNFYLIAIINKSTSERMLRGKCKRFERRNRILQQMLIFLVVILAMFDFAVIFGVLVIMYLQVWLTVLFAIASILLCLSVLVCYGLCHEDIQRVHFSNQPYEYKTDDSEAAGPISVSCRMMTLRDFENGDWQEEPDGMSKDLVREDPIGGSRQTIREEDIATLVTTPTALSASKEELKLSNSKTTTAASNEEEPCSSNPKTARSVNKEECISLAKESSNAEEEEESTPCGSQVTVLVEKEVPSSSTNKLLSTANKGEEQPSSDSKTTGDLDESKSDSCNRGRAAGVDGQKADSSSNKTIICTDKEETCCVEIEPTVTGDGDLKVPPLPNEDNSQTSIAASSEQPSSPQHSGKTRVARTLSRAELEALLLKRRSKPQEGALVTDV